MQNHPLGSHSRAKWNPWFDNAEDAPKASWHIMSGTKQKQLDNKSNAPTRASEDAPEKAKVITMIRKATTDPRLTIYDVWQGDETSPRGDAITLKFIAENPNDPACVGRWENDPRLRKMVEDAQAAKKAKAKGNDNDDS